MSSKLWKYKGGNHPEKDPKWLKDRKELFDRAGNGWWWGWTPTNCPISEMKDFFIEKSKKEKEANRLAAEKETSMIVRERLISKKKWLKSGRYRGEIINCAYCGKEIIRKTIATKYCGRNCAGYAYKKRTKIS